MSATICYLHAKIMSCQPKTTSWCALSLTECTRGTQIHPPVFARTPGAFQALYQRLFPAVKSGVGVRWLTAGGTHWWADWWSRQLSPHPGSRVLCNWSTSGSDQQSDQTRLSTDQIAICTLQVNPMQSHTGPSSSFQVKINELAPKQRSKGN